MVDMGDFNSAPSFARGHRKSLSNENAIDILLNPGFLTLPRENVDWATDLTFPSTAPDRAIDWIFNSPDLEQGVPTVVHSDGTFRPPDGDGENSCQHHSSRALRFTMAIRIVRVGSSRAKGEGLRIGTVRRPPRGVKKEEYASKNIYDVWFPNLSPSEALLKESFPIADDPSWRRFKRKFLAEMKSPGTSRDLDLLAALSHETNFAIGCYCEDESLCHRSILRELLEKRGAKIHTPRPHA